MPTATITTLESLRDALRSDAGERYDWTSLPTFGGEEPADTTGVWSWDADRLLVGTCADDLKIVSRAELIDDNALGEQWFAFRAYNAETYVGWGSAEEAERYAAHLSAKRGDVNAYSAYPLSRANADERALIDRCDSGTDTDCFTILDNLQAAEEM